MADAPRYTRPEYPDLLLSKTWDKKKSLAAKSKVKDTGVGEAMDAVQAAFNKVDWAKLEALNERPMWGKFHVDTWAQTLETAKSEATGGLRKLLLAAEALRDTAKVAAKRMTDAKLKDDAKLCEQVMVAAFDLAAAAQTKGVLMQLTALHDWHYNELVGPFLSMGPDLERNVAAVLKAMLEVKASGYSGPLFSTKVVEVRKVAQPLGNLADALAKGVPLNLSGEEARALYLEMKDWRDGRPNFGPETPAQTVALEVYKVREAMTRAVKIFK